MSYVGNQPARGQWRKLSDISSAFDGVITTFTTSVPPGTSEYFVTAGSASQLLISLGGVIQEPDVDYTVSTNSVTFTTPPTGGLSFFGVLCGDALNVGAPADGSVTTAKLAGGLSVGLTGGSASTPSLFFTGDSNTGLFSPSTDAIAFTGGGTEVLRITSAGIELGDASDTTLSRSAAGVLAVEGVVIPSISSTSTLTNKTLTDPAIIGTILEDVFTITDGAAFEVDPGNGSIQLITLGANRTPKATNFAAGEAVTLMVNDGTAYTLTWTDATWGASGVAWTGGSAPTLATTGYTVLQFWKVSTQVYGALVGEVA